jgi:two-component system sensor histidine kinase SenX3
MLSVILAVALVVVVVALLTVTSRFRALSRRVRRMSAVIELGEGGDLSAELPEAGTAGPARLARALNASRREIALRMAASRQEQADRDAILFALEEGVVLFDRDGTVVFENEQTARMLGGPLERIQRLTPSSLRDLVAMARELGSPQVSEAMAGPGVHSLAATAVAVPGDRVLLVLRDVTQARMIDAVRRDFVANASHELKTPAASIRALAETMVSAAADDPEAIARFAAQMEHEAVRLSRIISDLLDLSRLEGETAERTEVRFDRLVVDEAERQRAPAEAAGLSLTVGSNSRVVVRGSARDLGLMTRNLVQNAIQYTRAGGSIEVSVDAEGDQAILKIRDSGIGIPSRDQRRIFERFYRVDRARSRETGGTGLGLSIVKHVVENQSGTISVQSELGQGSTFTVRLPLGG